MGYRHFAANFGGRATWKHPQVCRRFPSGIHVPFAPPARSAACGGRDLEMLYVEGRRVLPDRVPVGHLGANEKKLIFEDGKPDRRLYEIATFAHLRDRLHSRDVWVEGSRSFRPMGEDLMPKPTFVALKGQDQLGLGVPSDCATWLTDVREMMDVNLKRLAWRARFREARWCEDGKRHADRDAAYQRRSRRGGSPQCRNHGHVSSGRIARSPAGSA